MKLLMPLLFCPCFLFAQEQLIGYWDLVSWKANKPNESSFYPYGENAQGSLSYSTDGVVNLFLINPGRSDEEKMEGKGYFVYTGDYKVVNSEVFHDVKNCSAKSWIGKEQRRLFDFSGDTLILQSPPISTRVSNDQPATHTLKWLPIR